MKKIISILLTVAMLACFAACSDETDNGGKPAYTFLYKGQNIAIRAVAQPIIDALGEPFHYEPLPTCGIGDLDQLYVYENGGLKITTYQLDGIDYIYQIDIFVDTVATKEGVSVGDSKQAVLDAYGAADKSDSACLTYEADGMQLDFFLDESEHVESIVYRYVKVK